MNSLMKKTVLTICIIATLTGCATAPFDGQGHTDVPPEKHQRLSTKTLWTLGGILVLGAILVHEGQDGVRDAVRDAEVFRPN